MKNSENQKVNLLRYWKWGVLLGLFLGAYWITWSFQTAGPGLTEEDIRFLSEDLSFWKEQRILEELDVLIMVEDDL